jgi:hypothetical protein
MLDTEGAGRFLDQCFDLWIRPELKRRGLGPDAETTLRRVLVLLGENQRAPVVRLDDEVVAVAKMKLRDGVTPRLGDPVFETDIEGIEAARPADGSDQDRAYVLLLRMNGAWHTVFDFRYNRETTHEHLRVADEFITSADVNLQGARLRPFADLLFSAAELLAKCDGMLIASTLGTHRSLHIAINRRGLIAANEGDEFRRAFNRLGDLRNAGRYLKGRFALEAGEAADLLAQVRAVRELVAQRATPRPIAPSRPPA